MNDDAVIEYLIEIRSLLERIADAVAPTERQKEDAVADRNKALKLQQDAIDRTAFHAHRIAVNAVGGPQTGRGVR